MLYLLSRNHPIRDRVRTESTDAVNVVSRVCIKQICFKRFFKLFCRMADLNIVLGA